MIKNVLESNIFKNYSTFNNYIEKKISDYKIEFFCGCISGWVQVLTMQPF